MKKKIRAIQLLRIIACLGVFTGHFLGIALPSKVSMNFLIYLRNSWISRTVLSYFYQGDTNVIIFFCATVSSVFCHSYRNDCS